MRRTGSFIVAMALAAALLAPGSAPAAPRDRGGPPPPHVDVYVATVALDQVAAIVALLAGFGLEQLASDTARQAFMERVLGGLLR
jgi:hypothetical protein